MCKRNNHYLKNREYNHKAGIGVFFIVLGLALLIATNDLLNLGSMSNYFTWETAMVFVGAILIFTFHLTPGILLAATGIWFMRDQIYPANPEIMKTFYWPLVIVLLGISYIISSFFRRKY